MNYTPEQQIKRAILIRAGILQETIVKPETVDAIWQSNAGNNDNIQDMAEEFRQSGIETNIEREYSRHYEAQSVAHKMDDGSWVGWTYWYGGGKHSSPEGVPWMDSAYYLTCVEKPVQTVERTFTKV